MLEYVLLVVGIALLVKSADWLIDGASSLARSLGVSTLVIGLTVVAFGTSLPELIVTVIAAFGGSGDIAFGNIIGSSMSNTLLVLGVIVVMKGLRVKSATTWKEIPFSFLAVLFLLVFASRGFLGGADDGYLSRADGIVMLMVFIIFLVYVYELARKDKTLLDEASEVEVKKHSKFFIFVLITGGLIGLFFGGKWTVEGAVTIARSFGLSEFLISATIIAVGTSLPELMTSIVAAAKKNVDLAVGNIIGSNIFNVLWVLGVTAVLAPVSIPALVHIDLIILLFVTFLLFAFLYANKRHELDKWTGWVFLGLYASYIVFLIVRG